MDEETKAWSEANGLSDRTIKVLTQEEFVSMQAIRTMTAEVIASFSLSSPQACLLKKAVLKEQSSALQPASVASSKDSSQLAQDLDDLEFSIMALSQSKQGVNDTAETAGQGKTLKSLPPAQEAIYLKLRGGKSNAKVNPLDLSYSEFIAGYFSILDDCKAVITFKHSNFSII